MQYFLSIKGKSQEMLLNPSSPLQRMQSPAKATKSILFNGYFIPNNLQNSLRLFGATLNAKRPNSFTKWGVNINYFLFLEFALIFSNLPIHKPVNM